jgi:hypothetical protein
MSKREVDAEFAKSMGASDQLPSSQILAKVQILIAF